MSDEKIDKHAQELNYARLLATNICKKEYPEAKGWEPLPDVLGILTQIDNMVAGMQRIEAKTIKEEPMGKIKMLRNFIGFGILSVAIFILPQSEAKASWQNLKKANLGGPGWGKRK